MIKRREEVFFMKWKYDVVNIQNGQSGRLAGKQPHDRRVLDKDQDQGFARHLQQVFSPDCSVRPVGHRDLSLARGENQMEFQFSKAIHYTWQSIQSKNRGFV